MDWRLVSRCSNVGSESKMCSLFQGRRKYWTIFLAMIVFVVFQVIASIFLTNSSINPFAFKVDLRNRDHSLSRLKVGSKYMKGRNRSREGFKLSFTPSCDIQSKEALSAISRAKSQECKQLISNVSCLMQSHSLIPLKIPRFCPQKSKCNQWKLNSFPDIDWIFVPFVLDLTQFGKFIGCYPNLPFILGGPVYNLSRINNPLNCLERCFRAGFSVAGVSNSTLCSCGHHDNIASLEVLSRDACSLPCHNMLSVMQIDGFIHDFSLSNSEVMNYSSLRHSSQSDIYNFCGGTHAINVFETGLLSKYLINKS